jgi:hypothetical protein
MDGEADAAGEYERLRAELADFVVDALAQRMAAGEQPELSRALADAIDRRVDEAVSARLASAEWPDPDSFAESVLAAAAGRGGGAASGGGESFRPRPRRSDDDFADRSRRDPPKARGMSAGKMGLIALVAIAVAAALAFYLLTRATPTTRTETFNGVNMIYEPTPDGSNVLQPPPGNAAVPTSAGSVQNVQGPLP